MELSVVSEFEQCLEMANQRLSLQGELTKQDTITLINQTAATLFNNRSLFESHSVQQNSGIATRIINFVEHAYQFGVENVDTAMKVMALFLSFIPINTHTLNLVRLLNLEMFPREYYLDAVVDAINKNHYSIFSFDLSKDEILSIAPRLTYLRIQSTDDDKLFPIKNFDVLDEEFLAELLSKATNLNELIFSGIDIEGSCLKDIRCPERLHKLVFFDTNFNSPLSEGMDNLESLKLISCDYYNFPFPDDLYSLRKLTLFDCPKFDQQVPVNLDTVSIDECDAFDQSDNKLLFLINFDYETLMAHISYLPNDELKQVRESLLKHADQIKDLTALYKVLRHIRRVESDFNFN